MNRLAVCLLLPWLDSTVSLAAGLATILLPMHCLAELGYRTETVRDTTQDVTKDFNRVNELIEQNETEDDVFFKDEVDNSNFLGAKALPDISLPEIDEYQPNIHNPSNSQPQASSAQTVPS